MDVAAVNGVHIAYRHRPGLGRTLVFANSLGSDQSIWDKVIDALPGGYGVLTYDLRGHGQSTGTCASIEELAHDVAGLIDHLGIKDVLFCGVSIGGMIGQVLSALRPDVLRGAVLCNTAPKIGTEDHWATRIEKVNAKGTEGVAAEIVSGWFGAHYASNADRHAMHQAMIGTTSDAGYLAACRAIQKADLSAHASSIKVPVLCISGSEDTSVTPDAVAALAKLIPGATHHVMEGIGHLPCLEDPQTLARLIEAFDPSEEDLHTNGMRIRRAVLGGAHVDKASANASPIDEAFQALITTGAWGQVWTSLGLSARERSMITLALLAGTANFEEIPMHIRATARTGATQRDISEVFQHVAIYAGVPRANHALKLAKQTLAQMDNDD